MQQIYLFDWGDTLMVDLPAMRGPMCDWPNVEAVTGAMETLQRLSQVSQLYVATGARDSTEAQIRQAFVRVGLAPWIRGYFCQANLGMGKDSPDFYPEISRRLAVMPEMITMVGDSLEKDIRPAVNAGLQAIWFNPGRLVCPPSTTEIHCLNELCRHTTE